MYRMYYTSDKIHKFYSTTVESCLKCKTNSDSIIHAFWECNEVQKLWAELERQMSEVLQCKRTFNSSVQIFQDMTNWKCSEIPDGMD